MPSLSGTSTTRQVFLNQTVRYGVMNLLPYAVLIGAIALAYSNIYGNSFLYDDYSLIAHNLFLQSWNNLPKLFVTTLTAGNERIGGYYRPLQSLFYLLINQTTGLSTTAFHLLNLSLHAANACLMYALGRKMGFHRLAVFAATLLWALHPVHTEAVTYMSGTADVLHCFFCLLGVLVLLPDASGKRLGIALVLVLLALLSKENSIAFPLLAASLIYFTSENRYDLRAYRHLWPFVAVVAVYCIARFIAIAGEPHIPPLTTGKPSTSWPALMPFATLPVYLRLLIWPTHLYMEHDIAASGVTWMMNVAGGLVILILSAIQIIKRQTLLTLPLSWGLIWFFVALLPVFYTDNIVYEHWMYLPTIGLFLGMAETIANFAQRQTVLSRREIFSMRAVCVVAAAVLGFLTYQQNTVWHDTVSFCDNIIAQAVSAPKAHRLLGVYYTQHGDYDKAMQEYQRAVDQSDDTLPEVQNAMAMTLLAMPDGDAHTNEALAHLKRSIEIDPYFFTGLSNIADFYEKHSDNAQAEIYRHRAQIIQKFLKTASDASSQTRKD